MHQAGRPVRSLVVFAACLLTGLPSHAIHKEMKSDVRNQGRLFRSNVTVSVAKAQSLFMERKYAEAADLFRREINRNLNDSEAYAGLGLSLAMQFKLDGAEKEFEQALKLDAKNAVAQAGKALVMLNRLQSSNQAILDKKEQILSEAEKLANLAVTEDPDLQLGHYVLGKIQVEQGKTQEAYKSFQAALEADPQYSQALSALGQIDLKEGRLDDAADSLSKAIALNSGNSTAHYALGEVLLQKGLAEQAIRELNISLYQHPNSAPVHLALGKAYEAQGNYAAALKQFERASLIKPEMKEAQANMAKLHVKLGEAEMNSGTTVGALKEFRQAILIDPLNPAPYLAMAQLREKRGDFELAISDLRSGLELMPDDPSLHKRIGDHSLKLGRVDDAISEYEKVLKTSSDSASVHGLTQALFLKAQGQSHESFFASNDYEDADKTLERAVSLRPNDLRLRLAQAKLRSLAGRPVDLAGVGNPQTVPEKIAYSEALMAQNRFSQSAEQMKDVINQLHTPQDAISVAEISMLNMDHESAEAAFQKAAALGSTERAKYGLTAVKRLRSTAQQRLNLANDLARKKQFNSALDTYRDATAADPKLAAARLGLAKAEEKVAANNPDSLRCAALQYLAYLDLQKTVPEKERIHLKKHAQDLRVKADKLDAKKG